ncbi:DUF4352 domain-containing protein [Streptomyces sp. NPDC001835]|uniref:DUF4352 domain-containing protein n=1 Tax=Streptomyces sp. NPDC001835 TaxID=3154528 RepID=UPI00332BFB75
MRTRAITTAALLTASAALTACSSSQAGTVAEPTAASSSPNSTVSKATAPSTLAFHQLHKSSSPGDDEYEAYSVTATVLGYEQPVHASESAADEIHAPGNVWAALDVKVCNQTGEITVSNEPWQLSYADGARVKPADFQYDDFPQPVYPDDDTDVPTGGCVRGKIVFNVPGGKRPATVVYSTEDDAPVSWSVPAA